MAEKHSLLRRQLRQCELDPETLPPQVARFVAAVDEAYHESDVDRAMLERALDLSSHELLQANAEMRAVLQAFPDLFLWLDRGGRVLRAQTGDDSDLYRSARWLVGRNIQDVPEPEASRAFEEALSKIANGQKLVSVEYSLSLNGEEKLYEARLLPLVKDQVLAIVRNITAERRFEQEAQRASKLESIGLLAGGIAHDFNNILMVVMGNLSFAGEFARAEPSGELLKLIGETLQATRRAKDLTHQLLTFSKGGAPIKAAASVRELIQDSAMFALRGSNVRCEYHLADDLWAIEVDAGQINQVLNNLIINADQAMSRGGRITIRADNMDVDGASALPLEQGRYVRLQITDEGIGIPPEQIDKIFDPYFTTKPKGTGLGLATCYSIVRRHDGNIKVHSEPDVGTTFEIYLPAASGEVCQAIAPNPVLCRSHKGLRVLIMDDEEQVLRATRRMLTSLGCSVEIAHDGDEALALYLAALGECPFDIVIMDLTIPGGLGGREAVSRLRQLHPAARVIAASGYSNDPVMAHHREYGFDDILAKPYSLEDLNRALQLQSSAAHSSLQEA